MSNYIYQVRFEDEYYDNLKEELAKVEIDMMENGNSYDLFFQNPFEYLTSEKYNIKLLDELKNNPSMISKFNKSVKAILSIRINRCFFCKLGILVLIYALLVKAGITVDLSEYLMQIGLVEGLKMLFDGTEGDFERLTNRLESIIKKLSIPEIALMICRFFKLCKPATE